MRGQGSRAALLELSRLRLEFGPTAAARKHALLEELGRPLPTPAAVLKLHEALCFMRAYPDDRALLLRVERMLSTFERRADLRRHRAALDDSGITGTAIRYRFFAETTLWLAGRWPRNLRIGWNGLGDSELLE